MDEKLAQKILDRINSLETNIREEISELKANQEELKTNQEELKANQVIMQYEISDIKTGQAIMQDEIKSIKRGQTLIIRSATRMQKDITYLKNETRHLNERIEAVLMDVETVDKKTEKLKMVQ